jgi:hypothetical protein
MRVSKTTLQQKVSLINEITNSPREHSEKTKDGAYVSNIGHFYLSQAYGGYCLMRIVNLSGGSSTPIYGGHVSGKEMDFLLTGFIAAFNL